MTSTALVADFAGGSIARVDLATGAVGPTVKLGVSGVTEVKISPDGRTVYAMASYDHQIVPVPVGGTEPGAPFAANVYRSMALTPDGSTLLAVGRNSDFTEQFVCIDVASGAVTAPLTMSQFIGDIVVSPDGGTAFIGVNPQDGRAVGLLPFDLVHDTAGEIIALPDQVRPTALAITPDGSRIYVSSDGPAGGSGGAVAAVDVRSRTVIETIAVDGSGTIAVSPDGKTVYVSTSGRSVITPIDVATNATKAALHLTTPGYAIEVSGDSRMLYVGGSGPQGISVIDAESGAQLSTIALSGDIVDIALVPAP